jgi:hypothetical protein
MAEDPALEGAVQEIVAWPLPALAVTPVGAPGGVGATGVALAVTPVLDPPAFFATTVAV